MMRQPKLSCAGAVMRLRSSLWDRFPFGNVIKSDAGLEV
jgi:hypothetical protein